MSRGFSIKIAKTSKTANFSLIDRPKHLISTLNVQLDINVYINTRIHFCTKKPFSVKTSKKSMYAKAKNRQNDENSSFDHFRP